jgi:hypothetical protein
MQVPYNVGEYVVLRNNGGNAKIIERNTCFIIDQNVFPENHKTRSTIDALNRAVETNGITPGMTILVDRTDPNAPKRRILYSYIYLGEMANDQLESIGSPYRKFVHTQIESRIIFRPTPLMRETFADAMPPPSDAEKQRTQLENKLGLLTSRFVTKLKELPDTQREAFIIGIARWFKNKNNVEGLTSSELIGYLINLINNVQIGKNVKRIISIMFPQTNVVETTFQEELFKFTQWFEPVVMHERIFYNENIDHLLRLLVEIYETIVQINVLHGGRPHFKKHKRTKRTKRTKRNKRTYKRRK